MFWKRQHNKAKLGTPENPEIIVPGEIRRPTPKSGRFLGALQILSWMLAAAAPAFVFDSIFLWLFELSRQDGNPVTWLLLLLVSPLALVASLVAAILVSLLILAFIANLFGRTTIRLARF